MIRSLRTFLQTHFFLTLILILSVGIRLFVISQGTTFHYDMARDAYIAKSIAHEKEIKIIGPPTDIEGIYHGVGYYYLLALPHLLSDDPLVSAGFMATLNAVSGVLVVYYLSLLFGNSKKASLLVGMIFAASYEMVQYGVWLSNPSPALITSALFFLGLWLWGKGNTKGFLASIISIALSLHFQLFLLYFFPVLAFFYLLYRPSITVRLIAISIFVFFLIVSPFLVAEVKFGFKGIHAFTSFFGKHGSSLSLSSVFLYLDKATSVIGNTIFPQWHVLGLGLFVVCFLLILINVIRQKNKKNLSIDQFLILWFLSNIPLFLFSAGSNNAEFSFIGVAVAILFIMIRGLHLLDRRDVLLYLIFLFITLANLQYVLAKPSEGASIFAIQGKMTYQVQKQIVNYTYEQAHGQPFSLCTLTIPLFVNTTWAYVYETYGEKKYNYLPTWVGQNQVGRLGTLPSTPPLPPLRFLIYEPTRGLPLEAVNKFRNLENKISTVIEKKNFDDFVVEKRILRIEKSKESEDNSDAFKRMDPENALYLCGV